VARIDYGETAAAAFQASRELPPDTLSDWRAAIARHLAPGPACGSSTSGTADALPLAAAAMDGAWLSTVVHHLARLRAVAATQAGPVIDILDLLVLRSGPARDQHART
jgi:hypothetical protein